MAIQVAPLLISQSARTFVLNAGKALVKKHGKKVFKDVKKRVIKFKKAITKKAKDAVDEADDKRIRELVEKKDPSKTTNPYETITPDYGSMIQRLIFKTGVNKAREKISREETSNTDTNGKKKKKS